MDWFISFVSILIIGAFVHVQKRLDIIIQRLDDMDEKLHQETEATVNDVYRNM